jgi:hypothetical protein
LIITYAEEPKVETIVISQADEPNMEKYLGEVAIEE